jgi:excisionase family DNA binding protein
LANLLGISRAKAYRLMQSAEVPVVRFGKSIRVPRESLLLWIAARTRGAPAVATLGGLNA